ncbi:MAG: serine/threonine-protein kinase, partial [Oscillospiraceae bacterium]
MFTKSISARNEAGASEYRFVSVLKSSEKGDIQLVTGDDGRYYVRRYRDIPQELFARVQGVSCPFTERLTERSRDENGAYIISEYIEGTPVSDCAFTEREAVNALLELCAAVNALHKAGIIHRDIKPSNIILGNDKHIRLIDFDSARLEKHCRSRDTEMLGTAGFAPPEQYGFMQTDNRSDIYSFGVTMKEILGENADKPKYRRIIERCTQFDPEKRYPDITEVSRAIKRTSRPNFIPYLTVAAAV